MIQLTGYFRAPQTGTYIFQVTSDDGVQLEINGTRIVDSRVVGNMLTQGYSSVSDPIDLTAG